MAFDLAQFASTPRVLDGATGTELQKRGLPAGACPELWNVDNPGPIREVAQSYVDAGSDIIITNSFGVNKFVLSQHEAGGRVAELAGAAAGIARQAASTREGVKVFGSLGPTGKIVMMDDVPQEEISQTFTRAATALVAGGVDAILLESFGELAELEIALDAVRSCVNVPVVISMTYTAGGESPATMMGNRPADVVDLAIRLGADAVGANCGLGPDNYVGIAAAYRELTSLPIWIKANAGVPEIRDGQTVFPMPADQFVTYVDPLIEAGATMIGGCCGTTPEYISLIRAAIDTRGAR
jgi:5-methyltetrahydrofolate--homocysteine methyltransferase